MNRHQVLTGACNSGDHCYAVGSVEGIHFTAYAAGCDIVILASDFQRVQIIPGVTHGNIKVSCIDCSTDSGKIAASYKSKVYIFEPTPLLHHESTHEEDECTIHPHKLDYQWYQTAAFEAESLINCLSWNLEGSRLLTGGDAIQIWHLDHEHHDEFGQKTVKFSVGGGHEDDGKFHAGDSSSHDNDLHAVWECIWKIKPSTPVYFLKYSHDGLLFASAGKNDRLVKIWYEDRKIVFPATLTRGDSLVSPKKEDLHYSFVYIAHPRTVTGFSWRKTSKFMPRGAVANMLVTSCADNVCRLWVETILPDDGLIDLEQFDPSASIDPKFHTHRHKKRFMQRLKTIRKSSKQKLSKLKEVKRVIKGEKSPEMTSVTEELGENELLDSAGNADTESVFSDKGSAQEELNSPNISDEITKRSTSVTSQSTQMSDSSDNPQPLDSPPILRRAENSDGRPTRPKKLRIMSEVMRRSHEFPERNTKRAQFSMSADFSSVKSPGSLSSPDSSDSTISYNLSPRSRFLSKTESSFSRHAIHKRKKHHKFGPETVMSMPHIDTMAGAFSVHDFHKFAVHQNGVCPTLHFHLAGSINPETDIPLIPVVNTSGDIQHNFQLHWLNNKELQFTMEAETILQEMHKGTLSSCRNVDTGSDSDLHSGHDDQGDGEVLPKSKKKHKRKSKSRKDELKQENGTDSPSHHSTGSDTPGSNSTSPEGSVIDALDRKIEALLRDWHQSPDMLFSIHPIDGSFLVWLVDWLDEYSPYSFRQAQVSFSSRLPHAFPVADARTMASNLMLYCNYSKMDIKSAMRLTENRLSSEKIPTQPAPASGKSSPGQNDNMLIPNVLMISKHFNGSLNQWQISFSETSKFATVVSVAHASRACGHRFRTNNAACHPVLPLLLTTSHHNVPILQGNNKCETPDEEKDSGIEFCSELILWRVDPVGPLSKSGGIIELARINAPDISAFIDVAWVPTLLPSSTLGTYCNSPSALFIASDGTTLKMYQAVIDARTLLLDSQSTKREPGMSFSSNTSSGYSVEAPRPPAEMFNIVSLQSSARPGCIIELEPIADGQQNWQKTQLLHVFQEQLLTGSPGSNQGNLEACVDLSNSGNFSENFYLVVLQKNDHGHGSILHMWKITISSQLGPQGATLEVDPKRSYVPDYAIIDDDGSNPPSRSSTPEHFANKHMTVVKLCFSTAKVFTEYLPLPEGVDIVSVEVAAGHLSSASIYPACLAPYLLVTGCSDGTLRFWRCDMSSVEEVTNGHSLSHGELSLSTVSFEYTLEEDQMPKKPSMSTFTRSEVADVSYDWQEWKMLSQGDDSSAVYVPGKPIAVSCAYSGRVAIAYKMGPVKTMGDKHKGKYVNLYVAIYECESTGGSEWLLEDTIELKNTAVPENNPELDLTCIYSPNSPPSGLEIKEEDTAKGVSPSASFVNLNRLTHVPSMETIHSVKKTLNEHQHNYTTLLQQKQLVQLDWVSTEDGSHILTVGVGSKILMYAQVSNDIVQACQKSNKKQDTSTTKSSHGFMDAQFRRQNFVKSKSLMMTNIQEDIQWMKLRSIELTAADRLPPLPMHISWVRGGILVVGMDNEMHVYSQWRNSTKNTDLSETDFDRRTLDDASLTVYSISSLQSSKSMAKLKPSYSMPSFKHLNNVSRKSSESNLTKFNKSKSESTTSLNMIQEFGLFEAYRIANPVLPQYHPKLLMELLNSGKTRRVKAILSHLVRCISGGDIINYTGSEDHDENRLTRPRTVSVSASSPVDGPVIQEEQQLDYKEIHSIPALPIYALLAADEDNTVAQAEMINTAPNNPTNQDYTNLFNTGDAGDEELNVDVFSTSPENQTSTRKRLASSSQGFQKPTYFGPVHARLLTKHLTHTQLPGLTSLDQMYLLALADTVANTRTDFADRFESENKDSQANLGTAESIDDCGLRFLLAMRHHIYLIRTLLPVQRGPLRQQGLKPSSLVWAYHSESTEDLLSYIPTMQKGEPTWEELKEFGAGWWINNINVLKRTMEKVAKAAFQANKDPMDAAIYYLAMKKKSVLWGLYRSLSNKKMEDFFRNDFENDRWRKAALKNAFDLLGKQRFTHAAAFFLLAGSLQDAVEVCLNNLNDIQLAIVISRLYDGEEMMPNSVKQILYTQILGCDANGDNYDCDKISPDPFLRSMSLWSFKDFRGSLSTLLQDAKKQGKTRRSVDTDSNSSLPSVFNFYNYLRTHPLLVRQRMASAGNDKRRKSVIPGFTRQQTVVLDDSSVVVDKVTPLERRLFFTTAHTHYKNGCPLLALEVLSKLPPVIENASSKTLKDIAPVVSSAEIETGTIDPFNMESSNDTNSSDNVDFGKPLTNGFKETSDAMDWSTPISKKVETAESLDWGAPSIKFDLEEPKFELSFSSDDSETESEAVKENDKEKPGVPEVVIDESEPQGQKSKGHQQIDIFAQQYAFIACLKVLMEEMHTLATGFEVDGGQLRFQLYIWLEKEVEVLQYLSNYGNKDSTTATTSDIISPSSSKPLETPVFDNTIDESIPSLDIPPRASRSMSVRSDTSYKPTLHEVILSEKMDFQSKLERMANRKQWLKNHQQLLRTLASYCMLQGAGGGGLASVQMELLLLLQELQQEKTQQQLLSPLPFPTTLPLLSAAIASSKTVIADPIQHLQCMTQDLLHSVIEILSPPCADSAINTIFTMRNLCIALSSCIYQCLCDCDSFVVSLKESNDASLEGFTSHNFTSSQAGHLMAGVQKYRRRSNSGDDVINTPPNKWPGVTSLRVLLAREKDDVAPKLNILLCESMVAVYVSLLVNALAAYDCHMLYRLVAHRFNQQLWAALFGGGVKTALKLSAVTPQPGDDDLTKQRMRLHMKVMGGGPQVSTKERKTFKETFLPPELSMITFFMTKPFTTGSTYGEFNYDSEETLTSDEEEEEYDMESDDGDDVTMRPRTLNLSAVQQHSDPNSYSWCLIRYSVVKLVLNNLIAFLPVVGIELPELPVCSPLLHAVFKTLEQWLEMLLSKLDLFSGPPDDFLSCISLDIVQGQPHSKYQALLNMNNTPFIENSSTLPIKRLWFHLIRQECLKEIFIRYVFGKRKQQDIRLEHPTHDSVDNRVKEPMKVIHKEQDIITAFAINQANSNCLALSTQKEIIELDVGAIVNPPVWLEDENEMDIEQFRNPDQGNTGETVDFYVVQTPSDGQLQGNTSPKTGASTPTSGVHSTMTGRSTQMGKSIHIPGITNPNTSHKILDRSRRLLRTILRRPVAGVRRIGSHPTLPHYITGSTDGSVRLYEWGHIQPLAMLRQPGSFPKVTKVMFSSQGNKCCVSDSEGDVCLWQVGHGSNFNKPIMSLKCHNKTTSDVAFVGSSSLIATGGHSSESRNVCLWDTLLPQRSSCVHAFTCHEHGCPTLVYAPNHQQLITGGRKGEICIFDIRQRQLRHTFQAHDSAVRCLALDPEEDYFVTGSAEGDIKIWALDAHQVILSFQGEHSKNTFFRNMGSASGVTQVGVSQSHHLFSCGVDGSMKFRALPERDSIVRYWT